MGSPDGVPWNETAKSLVRVLTRIEPGSVASLEVDATEGAIFGQDFDTPDGTCLRDYIHVTDLAEAHLLALDGCKPGRHRIYNLGNGTGFSVRQVVDVCREVTGADIPAEVAPRRDGDPAVLVASSERIRTELGWAASRDLPTMVSDAWRFSRGRAQEAGAR